jgi:hypothetical protein
LDALFAPFKHALPAREAEVGKQLLPYVDLLLPWPLLLGLSRGD